MQRIVEEHRLARVSRTGVVHAENGKLIVGDTDIVAQAIEGWGGNRQQGRVVVEIYVEVEAVEAANPDFGVFTEPSEPKK